MVGVGLTGKIKPLNGAAFPVWEDIDGQGGWRSVATIADRNSFSAAPLYCKEGMICYVAALQCAYELAPDLTTWVFYLPSPQLATQSDWYISPTGSINADGKTTGTAITQAELERRLFPRCASLMLVNDVTIHAAAGAYPNAFFSAGNADPASATRTLTVIYETSSSAEMVLTGVVSTDGATRTRGRVSIGAGGFVNHERIRLTSGPSLGALAYSTGLVAGNPLDTFVSIWGPGSLAQFHVGTPAAVGDRCVVDTLLCTVSRLEAFAHPRARVTIRDARIVRLIVNGVPTETGSADNGGNVAFIGCNAVSAQGYWLCNAGGASLASCRWEPGTLTALQGFGWLTIASVVQGGMGVCNGSVSSYGLMIDGGALIVGAEFTTAHGEFSGPGYFAAQRGYQGGGSIEVENGPGPAVSNGAAVTIYPECTMIVGDLVDCQQWGASTAYSVGYKLFPGAWVYQHQPVTGTIADNFAIPSVVNVDAAGQLFAYSDNEIFAPNQNCGLLGLLTLGGFSISHTDAQFYLTAQSGNLALADFGLHFQPHAGLYRVTGYVATTTADAAAVGVPTLNVIFTDDSGTSRTVPIAAPPSVTALGGAGGEVIVETTGAPSTSAIQWSVTGVINAAAAKYSARVRVEKVSSGP